MTNLVTDLGTRFDADAFIFGEECFPIKPIKTSLVGRIRIRIREKEFPRAWVRSPQGIVECNIVGMGDHWELCPLWNVNHTQP